MTKREEVQNFIMDYVEQMLPGGGNRKLYEEYFATLNDEQFDDFMKKLKTKERKLFIVAPNFQKNRLSTERNIKIGKKLGHSFFERLWIESKGDTPTYLTPIPYMVVDMPVCRQAQVRVKKISIPEDNKSVDDFTGQPTGKSKGSKISYPELGIMAAMGLDNSITELIKYRGGDMGGFNAMNQSISRTGSVSLNAISPYSTGVESTKLLKTLLICMHLKNTL
jgi:hypothetical protein